MTESSKAWIARKAAELKGMTLVEGSKHLIAAVSQYESDCGEPRPGDLYSLIIDAAYGKGPGRDVDAPDDPESES